MLLVQRVALVLQVFTIAVYQGEFTDASNISEVNFRLPNNTRPESYDLSIRTRIDENDFDFNGTIRIELYIVESTKSIVLHQVNQTIEEINLSSDGQGVNIINYTYNETLQFLNISVLEPLNIGSRYNLEIKYQGTLRDDYLGFYRTSYLNDSGDAIWLATTQFQAAVARHAFPCFDEPGIKVNTTIRITHGRLYSALSNMPVNFIKEK